MVLAVCKYCVMQQIQATVSVDIDFRYSGQAIFHVLMFHQMFEQLLRKHVSLTVIGNIQSKLDTLRSKVYFHCVYSYADIRNCKG